MGINQDTLATIAMQEGLRFFGFCGVDKVDPSEEQQYRLSIEQLDIGDMNFLKTHASLKFCPDKVLPETRSLWFFALPYHLDLPARNPKEGAVASYAYGRDYHKVLGKKLRRICKLLASEYPGHAFRSFVDAGPLAEVFWAEKAGLGFRGRNSLLITKKWGSYVILGQILSTLSFEGEDGNEKKTGACPPGCSRCIDACPTKALAAPCKVNPGKCISYLTIEHKGIIDPEIWPAMGNWVFGCDLCQNACPYNQKAKASEVDDFIKPIAGQEIPLEDLLRLTSESIMQWAGSPLLRAKRLGLVRNGLIAAANLNRQDLVPIIQELIRDEEPVVRATAALAIERIQQKQS